MTVGAMDIGNASAASPQLLPASSPAPDAGAWAARMDAARMQAAAPAAAPMQVLPPVGEVRTMPYIPTPAGRVNTAVLGDRVIDTLRGYEQRIKGGMSASGPAATDLRASATATAPAAPSDAHAGLTGQDAMTLNRFEQIMTLYTETSFMTMSMKRSVSSVNQLLRG